MQKILENYFILADREAFAALGFIVLFPVAMLIWAAEKFVAPRGVDDAMRLKRFNRNH